MKLQAFANVNVQGKAIIGTASPIEISITGDELRRLFEKKSGRTAFKFIDIETTAENSDDADSNALAAALQAASRVRERLQNMINNATQVFAEVAEADKKYFDVLPEGDVYRNSWLRFVVLKADYYRNHYEEYGKLKPGDRIKVTPVSIADGLVTCRFNGRVDAGKAMPHSHHTSLKQQLAAQAGKVFVVMRPMKQVVDEKGVTLVPVSIAGVDNMVRIYPDFIRPEFTLPDGSLRLPLTRAETSDSNPGFCKLLFSDGIYPGDIKAYCPAKLPDKRYNAVTGTVTRFDVGNQLVMAVFDDGAWSTGVFKAYKDGNIKVLMPVQEAARAYIPVGYPCKFTLDVELSTGKSSLLLLGVDPRLDGRMPFDPRKEKFDAGRLLKRGVAMAPVCVRGNELMMSSPDYTAFMPLADAPVNLQQLARGGVFSPDYKMPCDVSLVRLKDSAGGKMARVVCTPVKDVKGVLPKRGEKIHPRVVAGLNGHLFLMDGDVPVYCHINDESTFLGLLSGELSAKSYRVEGADPSGFVNVFPEQVSVDSTQIAHVEPGTLFCVEKDMKYKGVAVDNIPILQPVEAGTPMVALGFDRRRAQLVATSRSSELYIASRLERFRISILPGVSHNNVMIGSRPSDGKLLVCSLRSSVAETIFSRLLDLYDSESTMVVETDTARDYIADWNGIACQHDYSVLTADRIDPKVAELWDEVPDDTPILFGDIPLRRADLPGLPPRAVMPAAAASADTPVAKNLKKVVDTRQNTLSVEFEGGIVVRGARNLRIDFPTDVRKRPSITPLSNIFAPGSEWALEETDAGWRIAVDESSVPMLYEILTPVTNNAREHNFVARSRKGTIAIASDVEIGDESLMAYDEITDRGVLYVVEAEEHFVGRKLYLKIESIADAYLECSDITGQIDRRVLIPRDRVSWHPAWRPAPDIVGAVCRARVISVEDDCLVADRRCLLRQDALLKGMEPDYGCTYQMEVAGVDADENVYHLKQNGVEAWLPFSRAALFKITHESCEFLRPDDLVEVRLLKGDSESDYIYADRISLLESKISDLNEMADSGDFYDFSVHHTSAEGLFVELNGEVLFVDGRRLGFWKGDRARMDKYYPEGSTISLRVEQKADGKFELTADMPLDTDTAPEVGERCSGRIVSIIPGRGCYVQSGAWAAFVPEYKMAWHPLRVDHYTGLDEGEEVEFIVDSVEVDTLTIMADIRATTPEPADHDRFNGPHLIDQLLRSATNSWLMSDVDGWLIRLPYSEEFDKHKTSYLGGFGIIQVVGINDDGTLAGNMRPQISANLELRDRLAAGGSGAPVIIEAVIAAVDRRKLVVTSGFTVGCVPRDKCDVRTAASLPEIFKAGQTIRVVVESASPYTFAASIAAYNRHAAAKEIAAVKPGQRIAVRIETADDKAVYARYGNIHVAIPAAEVTRAGGVTPQEWAESRTGMRADVVVTDVVAGDATLKASRVRALAPGVEER